jgi:hypothetical protein
MFMDMTIRNEGEWLVTTIYAKPMVLYQYIPPNSCHPPGILTGLVFGQILQIYQLCSLSQYINKELSIFYKCLLNRGYTSTKLLPLFKKALTKRSPTYPSLRNNGKLERRPRLDGWMNESSSTSPTTFRTRHQDPSKVFGKT